MAVKYVDQTAIKYLYQHLPLQAPPKFTQIWIFWLKIHMPSGNPARGALHSFLFKVTAVNAGQWVRRQAAAAADRSTNRPERFDGETP
jgi:hypothetical protein